MKFIKKYEDYLSGAESLKRQQLSKSKITSKKDSFSNKLLDLWNKNLNSNITLEQLKKEVLKILNDPTTVTGKSTKNYWLYEIEQRRWLSKEQLLKTISNIILRAEGLGVMDKERYL